MGIMILWASVVCPLVMLYTIAKKLRIKTLYKKKNVQINEENADCSIGMCFAAIEVNGTGIRFQANVSVSGGYNINTNVGDIFVPEDYYSNYEFKDKGRFVLGGNVLCIYHKPNTILGAEGGFAYYQKYTDLSYSDNQGLEYTVKQRYHYLGLMAAIKVYPWKHGFNISAGGRIAAVLTPKGISYSSNQEEEKFARFEWATTSETERQMNEKLTGRPDASIGGGFGYEFPIGLNVNLRYHYGLTNIIRTEINDFNWAEQKTNSHSIEFSVGYLFNL